MNAIRKIFNDTPESISIPPEYRHKRVEIIILPLEEETDWQALSVAGLASAYGDDEPEYQLPTT